MTTETKTYNGWTNYETWSVTLIIDNDEGLHDDARMLTQRAFDNPRESQYWTTKDARRFTLADSLKEWVEEHQPTIEEHQPVIQGGGPFSYLWGQLISAALSEVDWQEIAEHYLEDLED